MADKIYGLKDVVKSLRSLPSGVSQEVWAKRYDGDQRGTVKRSHTPRQSRVRLNALLDWGLSDEHPRALSRAVSSHDSRVMP